MRTSTCLTIILAMCFATVAKADETGDKRPNIVFVFSDDHANHAIGAYGGILKDINPTPNIDALARQGMLFQNSFCTNSICGPSRAVIQTGKHSHKNGFMQNGNKFDGSQVTFPKLLQKCDYQTAVIGKWHLNTDPQGFDHWDVLPGQGDYYNPVFHSASGKETVEGHCTDVVTDKAIDWLTKSSKSDKPFMLMCQHKAPHRSWMPAIRHLDLYADKDLPEPDTLFDRWEDNATGAKYQKMEIDRHMHMAYDLHLPLPMGYEPGKKERSLDKAAWHNLRKMTEAQRTQWDEKWKSRNEAFAAANLSGKELVRWKYQRYVKNYLRCIKGVDESVGRIVKWLEDSDLRENTIVIYCSDQGFYLGDHGWYDKRWMYDESMKMPLIVSWPGVTKAGSVCKELVQNLDYAQTFLEIAGAEEPESMQGRSLVPLLRGQTPDDWRQSVYYHYFEYPRPHSVPRHCGVRTKDQKLINFYDSNEWEFYDLNSDPDEKTNVHASADRAAQVTSMKAELIRLQELYGDNSDFSEKSEKWHQKQRAK